jgi:hypothetical protein
MTRTELVRRLAEQATRPLTEFMQQETAVAPESGNDSAPTAGATDLFVWFEDTSARTRGPSGRRGIAGLPESLLPVAAGMKSLERRYVDGHFHLLSAVRIRCNDKFGERIAAIYTAALSVGTVAWIGTGSHYERAWEELASN